MTPTLKLPPREEVGEGLSHVLKKLMRESRVNMSQLSRNTQLGNSTIRRMLTAPDCNPTVHSLEKIAHFFGINTTQLLGQEPLPNQTRGYKPNLEQWVNVPVLALEEVVTWPEKSGTSDGQRRYVKTDLNVSENVYAILGEGESLEPKFSEGTVLIFDPDKKPRNKDYALLLGEGKELPQVRQLLLDGADIYAKTINPTLSAGAPLLLSSQTKILGILLQAKSNFAVE